MDQLKPAPLLKMKGRWRVDGVSQASWNGEYLKTGFVLSELKPDVEDFYSADACEPRDPKQITLNPHWLSVLTIGSTWNAGKLVSKPEPLPGAFKVDTNEAKVLSFNRSVKLGDRYTDRGIADPDFLKPKTHTDLIASLYVLTPILGNKDYKWMVIPCSELLRFYMGPTSRLAARVLRGQLDTLVEKAEVEGDTITIYEKVELTRLEAIVLGRAFANKSNYLHEMREIFKRLERISVDNQNNRRSAALSIEVLFPIEGITDLSVAGVPMKLADREENALFAMEILKCTSPSGYSNLIIKRADDIGVAGDQKVPGASPVFVAEEEDDLDDTLLDEPSDERLPKKYSPRYAVPFPWSDSISVEYQRSKDPREWKTESPRVPVKAEVLSLGDGTYEGIYKGNQEVIDLIETPPPPVIELAEFIRQLPELKKSFEEKKWSLSCVALNGSIPTNDDAYFLTSFPKIKGKRWKWHMVSAERGKIKTHKPRQLACIEIECDSTSGIYFYLIEIERKKDAHCTALLREENFRKLDKDTINNFLKVTAYNNGWPELGSSTWKNDRAKNAAMGMQSENKLLVGKSKHPHNRANWSETLLSDINMWLGA